MSLTGPPYPADPGPDSNAIGNFEIGVSQIGTIPPFNVWKTIISQYANSPIITGLILQAFNDTLDRTKDFDLFYDNIWNIATAVGRGLDIWGRIVGVNRVLKVANVAYFGFQEALPGALTFGEGVFYNGQPVTSNFALTDDAYRTLILAKAMANITNGSIPAINQILLALFPGRGNCYVTEGNQILDSWFGFQESITAKTFGEGVFYNGSPSFGGMFMTYTFEFPLTPLELAIVGNSGVLPKSTGVSASVVIL